MPSPRPLLPFLCATLLLGCDPPKDAAGTKQTKTADGKTANDGKAGDEKPGDEKAEVPAPTADPSAPAYGKHEYNFSLSPDLQDPVKALEVIANAAAGGPSKLDRKKCRRIRFYDTSDGKLKSKGYALRVRHKLDEKDCAKASAVESWDAAWKWRGSPAEVPDASKKLERDAFYGPGGFERESASFSLKAKGDASAPPPNDLLPKANDTIRALVGDDGLVARCGVPIHQTKWAYEYAGAATEAIEVSAWSYAVDKPYGVLEISFKVDEEGRAQGDALAGRLRGNLAAQGLIVAPVSKSKWAAANCPR